jgi:protein SCO1/2
MYLNFKSNLATFICSILLICYTAYCPAENLPPSSFYSNFADKHFVDQSGKPFNPADYLGKVTLYNFIYTKCSNVCPTQTKQLVEVYKSLPKKYQDNTVFVTISLDSQFDKPKVLKKYAQNMGAKFDNWLFVSGTYEDIKGLQDKLFLFGNPANPAHPKFEITLLKTKQKDDVLKNHMTILWVADKKGMLIQRYSAAPMDVVRLENELQQISDL